MPRSPVRPRLQGSLPTAAEPIPTSMPSFEPSVSFARYVDIVSVCAIRIARNMHPPARNAGFFTRRRRVPNRLESYFLLPSLLASSLSSSAKAAITRDAPQVHGAKQNAQHLPAFAPISYPATIHAGRPVRIHKAARAGQGVQDVPAPTNVMPIPIPRHAWYAPHLIVRRTGM